MSERRSFFRELSQEAIRSARQALEVRDQVQEEIVSCLDALAEEPSELDAFDRDFFDSYEMSYSMTLAYPREFFEQAAEKEGIEHRGVETLELVKTLHQRGIL